MGKFLATLFTIIIIFAVVSVGTAGYFGLIPPISALLGTDKPRDLGFKYSEKDFKSGFERSKVKHQALPKESTVQIAHFGKHNVEGSWTNAELTSAAQHVEWKMFPFKDVQIRINSDGTAEASGVLVFERISGWATAIGVSQDPSSRARKLRSAASRSPVSA